MLNKKAKANASVEEKLDVSFTREQALSKIKDLESQQKQVEKEANATINQILGSIATLEMLLENKFFSLPKVEETTKKAEGESDVDD